MEIYNSEYAKYPVNRQLKSTRSSNGIELLKKLEKQEKYILKRMEKAIDIFGNKVTPNLDLEELEKILNPNQKDMIFSEDIFGEGYEENFVIKPLLMMKRLEQITIGTSGSNILICKQPSTDIYIKPYIKKGKDNIYVSELLVVSKEVVDLLNQYQFIV